MPGPEPLTPTVLHLLMALSEGPQHGYALMQSLDDEAGIRAGPGTIYGTIGRLEDAGWVEALPMEGRRKRFRITGDGREALRAESERIADLARRLTARGLTGGTG